uniref:Protein ORF120 n=1 Tax=Anguillid herpesvirus 1 TaxID=150286 RepID=A0A8E5AJR1_9VIRU|nr:protein ORF120 [Anguillid herpesvirus 1]
MNTLETLQCVECLGPKKDRWLYWAPGLTNPAFKTFGVPTGQAVNLAAYVRFVIQKVREKEEPDQVFNTVDQILQACARTFAYQSVERKLLEEELRLSLEKFYPPLKECASIPMLINPGACLPQFGACQDWYLTNRDQVIDGPMVESELEEMMGPIPAKDRKTRVLATVHVHNWQGDAGAGDGEKGESVICALPHPSLAGRATLTVALPDRWAFGSYYQNGKLYLIYVGFKSPDRGWVKTYLSDTKGEFRPHAERTIGMAGAKISSISVGWLTNQAVRRGLLVRVLSDADACTFLVTSGEPEGLQMWCPKVTNLQAAHVQELNRSTVVTSTQFQYRGEICVPCRLTEPAIAEQFLTRNPTDDGPNAANQIQLPSSMGPIYAFTFKYRKTRANAATGVSPWEMSKFDPETTQQYISLFGLSVDSIGTPFPVGLPWNSAKKQKLEQPTKREKVMLWHAPCDEPEQELWNSDIVCKYDKLVASALTQCKPSVWRELWHCMRLDALLELPFYDPKNAPASTLREYDCELSIKSTRQNFAKQCLANASDKPKVTNGTAACDKPCGVGGEPELGCLHCDMKAKKPADEGWLWARPDDLLFWVQLAVLVNKWRTSGLPELDGPTGSTRETEHACVYRDMVLDNYAAPLAAFVRSRIDSGSSHLGLGASSKTGTFVRTLLVKPGLILSWDEENIAAVTQWVNVWGGRHKGRIQPVRRNFRKQELESRWCTPNYQIGPHRISSSVLYLCWESTSERELKAQEDQTKRKTLFESFDSPGPAQGDRLDLRGCMDDGSPSAGVCKIPIFKPGKTVKSTQVLDGKWALVTWCDPLQNPGDDPAKEPRQRNVPTNLETIVYLLAPVRQFLSASSRKLFNGCAPVMVLSSLKLDKGSSGPAAIDYRGRLLVAHEDATVTICVEKNSQIEPTTVVMPGQWRGPSVNAMLAEASDREFQVLPAVADETMGELSPQTVQELVFHDYHTLASEWLNEDPPQWHRGHPVTTGFRKYGINGYMVESRFLTKTTMGWLYPRSKKPAEEPLPVAPKPMPVRHPWGLGHTLF